MSAKLENIKVKQSVAFIRPCSKCRINCNIEDEQKYLNKAVSKIKALFVAKLMGAKIIETDEELDQFYNEVNYRDCYVIFDDETMMATIVGISINPSVFLVDEDDSIYRVDIQRCFAQGILARVDEVQIYDIVGAIGIKKVLELGCNELWEEIEKIGERLNDEKSHESQGN